MRSKDRMAVEIERAKRGAHAARKLKREIRRARIAKRLKRGY